MFSISSFLLLTLMPKVILDSLRETFQKPLTLWNTRCSLVNFLATVSMNSSSYGFTLSYQAACNRSESITQCFPLSVSCRLLQGTVIRPFALILVTNNLRALKEKYADDQTWSCVHYGSDESALELAALLLWYKENKKVINKSKNL